MAKPTPGTDNRLLRVCRLLNEHDVGYVVAGGMALALHGHIRATRDVDLLIPRDIDNARRLLDALAKLPLGLAREHDPETVARRAVTIIGDDPRVDLLHGAGQLSYDQANAHKEVRTIDGVVVHYVCREDLIRSKQTGRAQDRADIEALQETAGADPTE